MFAVFIHEPYEEKGGARDFFGTIPDLSKLEIIRIIHEWAIKEWVAYNGDWDGNWDISFLDLETLKPYAGGFQHTQCGQYISVWGIPGSEGSQSSPIETFDYFDATFSYLPTEKP
jgi:hypothetical protein